MKTDVGLILNEEQKWILGRTLFCNWEKSDLTRTQTIRLRRQGQAGVTTIHNVLCCFFICWSLWFQCLRWFQDIKVLLSTCIMEVSCTVLRQRHSCKTIYLWLSVSLQIGCQSLSMMTDDGLETLGSTYYIMPAIDLMSFKGKGITCSWHTT